MSASVLSEGQDTVGLHGVACSPISNMNNCGSLTRVPYARLLNTLGFKAPKPIATERPSWIKILD